VLNSIIFSAKLLPTPSSSFFLILDLKSFFKDNPNIQPDLVGNDYILERQLKPEARVDIVELLKGLNVKPTSMIDVSDGLASELMHLCTQGDLYL